MKLCALMIVMMVSAQAVSGDSSYCYSISDADTRNYCLAKANNDRSICYTIQRSDLRAQCMAEIG